MTMTEQAEKKTPEQMVEAVFALNLDPIKFKLMDKKEGHGWSREEADRRELEYKRFLALVARYPDDTIVPDTEVDEFWHGHILDTMKYAEDCRNVFGYFLHHFPYFGMRDDQDAAALSEAAANTRRLYRQEFGVESSAGAAYCARAEDAAYCARVVAQAAPQQAAYCAAQAASYCARVVGSAEKDSAYCAATAAADPAYCARAAQPSAAYCAAADAAYLDKVLGKGRPQLGKPAG
ncbi:MAG TPA: hypothetical protein VEC01_08475 [Noviherbaspirillum sp.]|uniref:glycine-rich domain-containing protein n=1 Tax=Noviherbaspirillum sp. TaxID=1926288 RepID=UPI002D388D30|nr:hypothetical protein [Noviherbaspirillum sp.]HYD95347.1 hypothetical protein [Noviherbaspirillum sp.]